LDIFPLTWAPPAQSSIILCLSTLFLSFPGMGGSYYVVRIGQSHGISSSQAKGLGLLCTLIPACPGATSGVPHG
jgi:hypothetical protein